MILSIIGHDFHFEMENICRLFFPFEDIKAVKEQADGEFVVTTLVESGEGGSAMCRAKVEKGGVAFTAERVVEENAEDKEYLKELYLAHALFEVFVKLTGTKPAWGVLTGVRPAKLFHRIVEEQGSIEGAERYFARQFFVSEEKLRLCSDTAAVEEKIIAKSRPESFSLYVSIPFCPTRCAYCSFVSETIGKQAGLLPEYLDCLLKEIEATGRAARDLGLRLETVYFGGGTPTILAAGDLGRIMDKIAECFDLSTVREYTVEGGRPDTFTKEKLSVIKEKGATRISINPQTLRDDVLERIGRRHTARQFFEAFEMARECGIGNINADLIAGLPGDDFEGFKGTLNGVVGLDPESVTLHTLYLKRASDLVTKGDKIEGDPTGERVGKMLRYAYDYLKGRGYNSYYMYRQTRTIGNHENTGWSKPGFEGLYNVYMMDETHTILAVGAGAVSKLVVPGSRLLERVFNFKFPYEYIRDFEQILKRKGRVYEFYDGIKGQLDFK